MAGIRTIRTVLVGAVKLVIFGVAVYAICAAALSIRRASLPTSKDACDRVELGMTIDQIDKATNTFEGWQLLRDDGVMVISTGPRRENPVCRVLIDPHTHQAVSKSMAPLQQGDWPTL
jgi:hypothetical protein